jgi:hypothetical protein
VGNPARRQVAVLADPAATTGRDRPDGSTIVGMAATADGISVVPANEASWEDLQTVFRTRGPASRCQCQRYKLQRRESFASFPVEERAHRLRQQTDCGDRWSDRTSGLLAHLHADGPPATRCGCALVLASVAFARERGARALEGYPITTTDVILEELHVGTQAMFAAAGFNELSSPTPRRVVMRIDF